MRINIGGFAIDDQEKMRRYLTKPLAVEPSLTNVRHDIYGKEAADQEKVKGAEQEYSKRVKRRALMNRQVIDTVETEDTDSKLPAEEAAEIVREVHNNTDWADSIVNTEVREEATIETSNESEFCCGPEREEKFEEIEVPEALHGNDVQEPRTAELRMQTSDDEIDRAVARAEKTIQKRSKKVIEEEPVEEPVVSQATPDYDKMDIKVLYEAVRMYMKRRGVANDTVSIDELNEKFGANAIKRLRRASYLIVIGKGVTITDV